MLTEDEMDVLLKEVDEGYKRMMETLNDPFFTPVTIGLDCECGKEKHGFASHSDWCPKYKNETNI